MVGYGPNVGAREECLKSGGERILQETGEGRDKGVGRVKKHRGGIL